MRKSTLIPLGIAALSLSTGTAQAYFTASARGVGVAHVTVGTWTTPQPKLPHLTTTPHLQPPSSHKIPTGVALVPPPRWVSTPASRTRSDAVLFQFTDSKRGVDFQCRLAKTRYLQCPHNWGLIVDPGWHVVYVRATYHGKVSKPITFKFYVIPPPRKATNAKMPLDSSAMHHTMRSIKLPAQPRRRAGRNEPAPRRPHVPVRSSHRVGNPQPGHPRATGRHRHHLVTYGATMRPNHSRRKT